MATKDQGDRERILGTVLFSDVVASTELAARVGDSAWRDIVDRLERTAESTAGAESGRLVKGTGDGVLCVFERPSAAVATALALHREAANSDLALRSGIHTGEIELRGDDISGIGVNVASRIEAAARPGEILVSATVHDLVAGSGIDLIDRGDHELRGVPGSWRLYAVGDAVPMVQVPEHRAGNLPAPIGSFVGRTRELETLTDLVLANRLTTLRGAGGIGKTRISIELGRRIGDRFGDGVWFVDLAPLSDGAVIAREMLGTFGLDSPADLDPTDALCQQMADWNALMILDNCEHLIDDIAPIARRILEAARGVVVLATSRDRLSIAGEVEWRLPRLDLDGGGDAALNSDAARLFLERAQAARPDLELGEGDSRRILSICQRLDGLPLAIELAAARLRSLSLSDLERRLDDRFRLLTGGDRTAVPHHRTLLATVDWSYDLLTEEERSLYRRLSAFAGGFTVEAAEALAGEDCDVLSCLERLVDQSLVIAEPTGDGTRYHMLETMRQHGRDLLDDAEELEEVRRLHFEWTVSLAVAARKGLGGRDPQPWLSRVRQDHDNIRAALTWALEHDPVAGVGLTTPMSLFWWAYATEDTPESGPTTSYLAEGASWSKRMLEAAGDGLSRNDRARAQHALGGLLQIRLGEFEEATKRCAEAKEIFHDLGDVRNEGWATFYLGGASFGTVPIEESLRLYQEALALHTEGKDAIGIAISTLLVGFALVVIGDTETGRKELQRFAKMAEASGSPNAIAHAEDSAMLLELVAGHVPEDVEPRLTKAVELFSSLGHRACLTHTMMTVSLYHALRRDMRSSAEILGAAEGIRSRLSMVTAPYEDRRPFIMEAGLGDVEPGQLSQWMDVGRSLSYEDALAMTLEGLGRG